MKGFTLLGDSTLSNDIQENLISYLDWGLLSAGNSVQISLSETGVYGADDSRLRLVEDPRYEDGQIWSTVKPNIVWESGAPSGVYVNNIFYSIATTGTYAHHIDHIHGVVRFDTEISPTSIVQMPHSYKYVTVTRAGGLPWFTQVQKRAEIGTSDFINGSGDFGLLPENRQSLPVIGIELAGRTLSPYQLGGGQTVRTEVYAHCIAEDAYMRDLLVDILTYQSKISFKMYDINDLSQSGSFPLDYRGVPVSGAMTFPLLVENFPGRTLYIENARLDSLYTLGSLYVGSVKLTTEVIHIGV